MAQNGVDWREAREARGDLESRFLVLTRHVENMESHLLEWMLQS